MPAGVTFGAIRWDAWWSLAAGSPANETRAALSDADYQFRAPIHSQVLSSNVITFETTQAKFDDDITFAASTSLHYWAYLLYPETSPMIAGIHFHMSSSIASQMKFCLIVPTDGMGSTGNYSTIIDAIAANYISKSFYFTLPSGKPLLYIYYTATDIAAYWGGNIANLKTAIDYLKSKITASKGVAPYVIALCGADDTTRIALGADAVSNYISAFNRTLDGTYAALATSAQNYWATMASAVSGSGGHIAPICMMGWNSIPRKRRPVSWQASTQIPEHGMRSKYAFPTNTEAANHVQAAVTYVQGHSSICPEKTILCYAYNENDEGGYLNKTIGDPTGSRLTAVMAPVLA